MMLAVRRGLATVADLRRPPGIPRPLVGPSPGGHPCPSPSAGRSRAAAAPPSSPPPSPCPAPPIPCSSISTASSLPSSDCPSRPARASPTGSAPTRPPGALDDLAVFVDRTTRLIPEGRRPVDLRSTRWAELAAWLATSPASVVDAGTNPPPLDLLDGDVRSLLVTRACYLALRRAAAAPCRPDGVVLVTEPGRALRAADVARAVGAPVVASVSHDPAIARAVDAGLLTARLPRLLARELRGAA